MKHAKHLLAMFLVFALALALALPALAIEWDDFRIVTQPQSQTVDEGERFTLSVAANIPDGAVAEYHWYVVDSLGNTTTAWGDGPTLSAAPGWSHYVVDPGVNAVKNGMSKTYYCEIRCYELDDEDEVISERMLTSDTAKVTVEIPKLGFGLTMYAIFVLPLFETAGFVLRGGLLAIPLLAISPIVYLFTVLWRAVILAIS